MNFGDVDALIEKVRENPLRALLACGVMVVIVGGGWFLSAYMAEKGRQLATTPSEVSSKSRPDDQPKRGGGPSKQTLQETAPPVASQPNDKLSLSNPPSSGGESSSCPGIEALLDSMENDFASLKGPLSVGGPQPGWESRPALPGMDVWKCQIDWQGYEGGSSTRLIYMCVHGSRNFQQLANEYDKWREEFRACLQKPWYQQSDYPPSSSWPLEPQSRHLVFRKKGGKIELGLQSGGLLSLLVSKYPWGH